VVSKSIIIINFMLRLVIILWIMGVGFPSFSVQVKHIKNMVFVVQFFNTGIILLFINSNLEEYGLGYFNGRYRDFTPAWYMDIGETICGAMFFNIFFPIIEFFIFFALRCFWRLVDMDYIRCSKVRSENGTKCKTIQSYVDIYGGPIFQIHYKYSTCANIVFITFMYGPGMPFLFPMATMALFVLYSVERLLVAYSYKEPPSYDDKINKSAINMLMVPPILYMAFGYWMYSNQQIFNDKVIPINYLSEQPSTDHVIWQFPNVVASVPLFLMSFPILIVCVGKTYYKRLMKLIYYAGVENLNIEEKLDPYFDALSNKDRQFMMDEEKICRQLEFKILTDMAYSDLQARYKQSLSEGYFAQMSKIRRIQGCFSYDILANPTYQELFQYMPANIKDREKFIIDHDDDEENDAMQSNQVRLILNLAFLDNERQRKFQIDKTNYSSKICGNMFKSIQAEAKSNRRIWKAPSTVLYMARAKVEPKQPAEN
jgi:hypothetical protein